MKPWDEPIDPRLEQKLNALRDLPHRDPQAAGRGRAAFLGEAQSIVNDLSNVEAVSVRQERRHIGWIETISTRFGRKERSPMFTSLLSIFIVVSLLLGGTGATVFAAQDSLPGQALFGVKTASEDVRLDLARGPLAEIELGLEFANRRVKEVGALVQQGAPVPEALLTRYERHMEHALQRAAGLDDIQMIPALEQARDQLREQERAMLALHAQAGPQAEAVLARVRQMIQTRLGTVENGLADPQGFRNRSRQGGQGQSGQDPAEGSPGAGSGYGSGPQPSGTPGTGYGPGPFITGTPTPGSGYGPGPGPSASHEPGDGQGYGAGESGRYGPGPQVSGTPVPGSGYGPGPGPDASHTPEGQQQGPGPNPDSGGNGGGNGEGGGGNGQGTGSGQGGNGDGDGICDGCGDGPGGENGSGGGGQGGRP